MPVSHVCLMQSRKYPSKTVQDYTSCGIMFYINVLRDYDKKDHRGHLEQP